MNYYIKKFCETSINDVALVGGKNASLGEMYSKLRSAGVSVPDGFATTAFAFSEFLNENLLNEPLNQLMAQLERPGYSNLAEAGKKARSLILGGKFSDHFASAILKSYSDLCGSYDCPVAVRSSATAEDLPTASFAGQHESYLNVRGKEPLLLAVKKCFASLYTDRAIKYREDNSFAHSKVALSVGIQKMVRADKGSSGVIFTLEPESGFRNVIHISGVWGLGENIVQGAVIPDEFLIFKPTLEAKKNAIIQKRLGTKAKTLIYGDSEEKPVVNTNTPNERQRQFVLCENEISKLATWAILIENHYNKPMDIEWAKDGITNELFIIQARPETVHSQKNPLLVKEYKLLEKGPALASGQAIGSKIATGKARILQSPAEASHLQPGDIIVTDIITPDWDPVLQNVVAIVTNKGGRTSHASIVARELQVPAIVGCGDATATISDGEMITVSCAGSTTGVIYRGVLKFQVTDIDFSKVQMPENTGMMLIIADPDRAFELSFYPNDGVGLMRIEFVITHAIGIHPMALVKFDELKDEAIKEKINLMTQQYADKKQYFVDRLAQGIATIAAAFYPKPVIVRMSDFKTNEYANLLGGRQFEPDEENPMMGFRGASRYYNDLYKDGFRLECEAILKVRDEMGFSNVKVMIPFCRTVKEGKKVIAVMNQFGLEQGINNLEIYMMAEIPSNVILAEEFAAIFDGFSIGSNDLTQLTLGIDRDSAVIQDLFNELDDAPMALIGMMIKRAHASGSKVGLCGQAPSDFPDFACFLVDQKIDTISFNPDALLKGIANILQIEKQRKNKFIIQ